MKPFKPWTFPSSAIHIAIDLETASTEPNAAIVQLAAVCKVGPVYHEFNEYISLLSNEQAKRDVSKETMEWWNTQDPALRSKVFGGKISLYEALNNFYAWAVELSGGEIGRVCLWGNGVDFDNVILKSAFELYATWPFNFRNNHHMRTLMAMVPLDVQESKHVHFLQNTSDHQAHDALSDARYQHAMIRAGLDYYGIH
jgi:hypothetical protein